MLSPAIGAQWDRRSIRASSAGITPARLPVAHPQGAASQQGVIGVLSPPAPLQPVSTLAASAHGILRTTWSAKSA